MTPETACKLGTDARDLSHKDRITLQSRILVMYINGESDEKIFAYVESFKREFRLDLSATEGIGAAFVDYLARAGWALTLVALVVHHAAR